ncbi:MAG: hemerythrin domain-containing protein [Rhizobiales bacterium]|nr:hemerythrin domain-containing protein [Hyphomicrobiales bacterium]MBN9009982.1 hemerythrin domain-containing protein [Hyphomicrobiales bacterium]
MSIGRPLEAFEAGHAELARLCADLEKLADGLPDNVDSGTCDALAHRVPATVSEVLRGEEDLLFPYLTRRLPDMPDLATTLTRLKAEHHADLCYAEEVEEALADFAAGRPGLSTDAIGYMLRGFFDGQRRHIAAERQLLLPLFARLGDG